VIGFERCIAEGYADGVAKGADSAKEIIASYLGA
jgi:hypothetical protein